jgi:hypothetical protein
MLRNESVAIFKKRGTMSGLSSPTEESAMTNSPLMHPNGCGGRSAETNRVSQSRRDSVFAGGFPPHCPPVGAGARFGAPGTLFFQ